VQYRKNVLLWPKSDERKKSLVLFYLFTLCIQLSCVPTDTNKHTNGISRHATYCTVLYRICAKISSSPTLLPTASLFPCYLYRVTNDWGLLLPHLNYILIFIPESIRENNRLLSICTFHSGGGRYTVLYVHCKKGLSSLTNLFLAGNY
jgi:hypothetical protein